MVKRKHLWKKNTQSECNFMFLFSSIHLFSNCLQLRGFLRWYSSKPFVSLEEFPFLKIISLISDAGKSVTFTELSSKWIYWTKMCYWKRCTFYFYYYCCLVWLMRFRYLLFLDWKGVLTFDSHPPYQSYSKFKTFIVHNLSVDNIIKFLFCFLSLNYWHSINMYNKI